MEGKVVHKELSYRVVGILFEVYNEIGYGHKENVYQRAISAYFRQNGIPFKEQVRIELVVAGEKVGIYYLDFLVDNKIILEIKAQTTFRAADFRQCMSYLKTTGRQLAILAAFAPDGVRSRRILNIHNSIDL